MRHKRIKESVGKQWHKFKFDGTDDGIGMFLHKKVYLGQKKNRLTDNLQQIITN